MNQKCFRPVNGIFLLDKPLGISSNQALQNVKNIFAAKKAGHTGSLDVLASGLLPICFGEATKFSQFLLDADKTYRVTARLGEKTSTADAEGEVIETKPIDHISEELLNDVLEKFKGEMQQVPPMYSALKRQGQPLYKLARQGITVEREARTVNIYSLKLIKWDNNVLALDVHCSKGTYIRTLMEDIGEALNSCAYVTELRRLSSGPFKEAEMLTLEKLQAIFYQGGFEAVAKTLLPIDTMIVNLPEVILSSLQVKALRYGQSFPVSYAMKGVVRLYEAPNRFIGIGEIQAGGKLVSIRLLQTV